jgi:hypothetical protein
VTALFLVLGGSIFAFLGAVHAIYTLMDVRSPRRFAPTDMKLADAMKSTGVRLSRGRTNMWDAWLGFNLSHGLGAVFFGVVCISAGVYLEALRLPKPALLIPALVGLMYFALAIRFWFRVPAVGIGAATAFFLAGWLMY